MVAEGRFAPLPSLVLFWRSLDREVPVDSILNINNMASGLHIFHLGFFLIPLIFPILYAGVVELADTRDLKSGGSICPPNLKSPVKSSVFQFSFPESIAQFSPEFSPVWNLQFSYAAVLESVDKADLKSARILLLYGFESRQRHHRQGKHCLP